MPPTAHAPARRTPPASNRPRWARAVTLFGGQAFDVGSTREYAAAAAEYATLSQGERDYYRDHLLFRQTQALEGIHDALGVLVGQSDRAGRTMAVGFRGALELLQEIAADGEDELDGDVDGAGEVDGEDVEGGSEAEEEPGEGDALADEPEVSILDAAGEEIES